MSEDVRALPQTREEPGQRGGTVNCAEGNEEIGDLREGRSGRRHRRSRRRERRAAVRRWQARLIYAAVMAVSAGGCLTLLRACNP